MTRRDDPAFRSTDGRFRLVIADELVTKILEMCLASYPLETGGVLIGHYNETLDTAVATRATGPHQIRSGGGPPSTEAPRGCTSYSGFCGQRKSTTWANGTITLGAHLNPVPQTSSGCRRLPKATIPTAQSRSCWSRVKIVRLPHTYSPVIRGWCDSRQGMTKVLPEIAND